MRLGASSPRLALPVPVINRREDVAERPARQPAQAVAASVEPVVEREVTRIRARAATAPQQTGTEGQRSFTDAASQRTRNALLSYASNGPSIEERLGVELAGIDVYA